MKKTIEERVKTKLYKLGKKNRICSVLVLPVLLVWVLFFRAVRYCRGNVKRFSMVAMTMVFFVVYSSFSFPMFIMAPEESAQLYGQDSVNNEVFLVEEEELNMEDVELLDDNEVLEEFDFNETSHGMTVVEKFDADEILRFTEDRASKSQDDSAGMNRIEEEISGNYEDYEFAKDDWRLVLINKQHSVPEDYTFELGYITSTMRCDERIIDDLRAMLQAAKEDAINLEIKSPYRDEARQEWLFNRKIKLYMNQGMSFVEAHQLASQAVTVPGASEHQIGLALDIVSDEYIYLEEEFGETEAGIWLAENSYRYGFIVRYPKGKEYITGIGYEPWHFRYVGVEAATVITKNGITLEEFWEELE